MVKSWVIAGCWELYERREIALGICLQGLKSPSPAAHFKKEETNRPATAEAAAVSSERVRVRERESEAAAEAAGPAGRQGAEEEGVRRSGDDRGIRFRKWQKRHSRNL